MLLSANFPGKNFPPATIVAFSTPRGRMEGEIRKLNKYDARVIDISNQMIWKVPYHLMKIIKKSVEPEISLQEIYDFAMVKFKEYKLYDWKFGFDLAQNRGGVCRYREKVITVSVTYCMRSSRNEVYNTILHEIAHALVGPGHGHNQKWQLQARAIGCDAERCHSVTHGLDRWHGTCPCGNEWKRKKLMRKIRNAKCPHCWNKITWKEII